MGDSSKKKSATRTSSRSTSSADNVSAGVREMIPRAELEAHLQASPGPVTSVKDARSWLEAKGWILAGENYTKPKLADILFTVALTQKLPSDSCAAIKAVAFLIKDIADRDLSDSIAASITDRIASQISSSIDNLTAGVASTKEFLDAVAQQQAETTVKLQESTLSNAESSKSITNAAEKLSDASTRQSQATGSEWPMLPSSSSTPANALHPASLVHTTFSAAQIKIQQRTLLAVKQLLIELGPLGEEGPATDRSVQNQVSHRDLLNGWFDEDDKANNKFEMPSKAVRGVTIFDRPAILVEFDSQESKSRFIKLCDDTPGLLARLSPNARIRPRTYPVIFRFVPCSGLFDPSNAQHLRDLEIENDLSPNSISSAEWCKKPEKRSPGQATANLKVHCASAESANRVLQERIRVDGNLVNVHKDLRQPLRCVKCHEYGHFKDACPNKERCALCASDTHTSTNCSNSNAPSCAACGDGSGHPASSPICPTFLAKQKALLQRFPENSMPYYPTGERWTWAQNPTNPDRPQSPLPPEPHRDQQFDRQNIERFDHYKRKLNRQNNRRANTDTYIPDNGWPRERRQFTLNEVWAPRPNRTSAAPSQPANSQQNASSSTPSHSQ
jgi:hypothetical protein